MDIVITAATEAQVDAMNAQVCSAFPDSDIHKFTDIFFAVQFIVNQNLNMVFADAEMRNPFNQTKFIKLVREYKPSVDITIVSENEKNRDEALETGADFFTSYERLGEVLAELRKPRESFGDE